MEKAPCSCNISTAMTQGTKRLKKGIPELFPVYIQNSSSRFVTYGIIGMQALLYLKYETGSTWLLLDVVLARVSLKQIHF